MVALEPLRGAAGGGGEHVAVVAGEGPGSGRRRGTRAGLPLEGTDKTRCLIRFRWDHLIVAVTKPPAPAIERILGVCLR